MKTLIQQYHQFNSFNTAATLSQANMKLCWVPRANSESKIRFCVPVMTR